jgi:hypothetical protein
MMFFGPQCLQAQAQEQQQNLMSPISARILAICVHSALCVSGLQSYSEMLSKRAGKDIQDGAALSLSYDGTACYQLMFLCYYSGSCPFPTTLQYHYFAIPLFYNTTTAAQQRHSGSP